MSQFSERLRKLRKERKIRQKELGAYLGYGATAIVNYESGRNEPSLDSLIKLAEYFGVSVGYLIGSEPEAKPSAALSAEEMEWLLAFSRLSAEQKDLLLHLLRQIAPAERYTKNISKGD